MPEQANARGRYNNDNYSIPCDQIKDMRYVHDIVEGVGTNKF